MPLIAKLMLAAVLACALCLLITLAVALISERAHPPRRTPTSSPESIIVVPGTGTADARSTHVPALAKRERARAGTRVADISATT